MTNLENGVAVFIDSDGTLCWKTADGVVRRGAKVTKRDAPGECGTMEDRLLMERAVLGSSAVDVGVGSASTLCIRDGEVNLGAAPADGVRVADVAASLDRIADALNNDPASSAVVAGPTVPLDADGKPIVVGAFYVGSTCGPCLSVHLNGSVVIGAMVITRTRQLRRVPITSISVVNDYGLLIHDVRSGNYIWQGRMTQEQATKVIEFRDADQRERETTRRETSCLDAEEEPHDADAYVRAIAGRFGVTLLDATTAGFTTADIEEASPPPKPIVRCGQRWRLDGVEVELYDSPSGAGLFMARNWDGVRVTVFWADLKERGAFLSGPTVPETKSEAVRRVLEIEASNPPDGIGRDEWRARLINRMRDDIKSTATVRMMACASREEHVEKWRKFGGGR